MKAGLQNDAPLVLPDLHGCPDFFQLVLDRWPDRPLIFLGDAFDRGPDVPGLLRLIRPLVESGRMIALWGNHDFMASEILLGGMAAPGWERSYLDHSLAQYPSRQAAIDDAGWMRAHLASWHVWRHVYLSHAAPHRAWNADREFPEHLWGRPGEDSRSPLPDGCTLAVHGHTVTVTLRADRQPLPVLLDQPDGTRALYLDTGAFHTGVLTVLDLADMQCHAITRQEA